MNKTKKGIFQAAIKVFSLKGYNGATMDEIAQAAGVAKGTLYYHFKSKEEIFKYIITEGMEIIKNDIDEVVKDEEDPLEKLKGICRMQLDWVYKNRDFFKVVMSQLWGQEFRQLQLRTAIRSYINDIQVFIKEAMDKGFIVKDDTCFMSYTFFGNLCSAAIYELINGGKDDIELIKERILCYIFDGISVS